MNTKKYCNFDCYSKYSAVGNIQSCAIHKHNSELIKYFDHFKKNL